MASVIESRHYPSTLARHRARLAMVTVALLFMACSRGSGDQPGTGADRATTASPPTTVSAPAANNGGLVFSRVVMPSADGVPLAAQILELSDDGSVGLVLAEGAAHRSSPSWSPDGRAFAYAGAHGIRVWRPSGDVLVAPCDPSACSGSGSPAWSPSGTAIAFAGEREGVEGLFQVSPRGGQVRPIVTGISLRGAPAWSPDGESIAIIVTRGADSGIVILDADSGQTQEQVVLPQLEIGEAVAWSPDGDTFAVEAADGPEAAGIYMVARDGTDLLLLSTCPEQGCTDLAPAFSPDGRWVVFTRARCDEPRSDCFVGDVWVVASIGGNARALTSGAQLDCCAAWGPLAR